MKTSYTILLLSIVIVIIAFSSAEPDWNAVEAKYEDMEESWQGQAEKALEIMEGEVDAETLKSASQLLHTFYRTGTAMNIINAYLDIANKDLTAEKAKDYHDEIIEQENLINEQFKPFKAMLMEERKGKLEELFEDFQNYRLWIVEEIMQLLEV